MAQFAAQARITLEDPLSVIRPLCEHMAEHGAKIEEQDGDAVISMSGSRARFSSSGGEVLIEVSAPSAESFYFIRMNVASHILEFAGPQVSGIVWDGDSGNLARPPNFQILEVRTVRDITPHMRRITFAGNETGRFGRMDALHLNILIQHPGLEAPQWPSVGPDGLIKWADPQRRPDLRKYTVRSLDPAAGTLDIDFVLHADAGPGSAFATNARIGDHLGVIGPGGGGLVEAGWYLFAGDETALPAIARMLEALPETARGIALIEVADEGEICPLRFKAAIDIQWLLRNGAPAGTTNLLADHVRAAAFPEDRSSVYAWAGCEYGAFRQIRNHLRQERGLRKEEHLAVSYWRREKQPATLVGGEA